MKFWKVFLGLLLFTPALHAQIPLYYYPYLPYSSPYYPQPAYDGSYYLPPYTTQLPYPFNPYSMSDTNETINRLNRQIQQLNDEVLRLQTQILQIQAPPPQTRPTEIIISPEPTPAKPITLILKNGKEVATRGYAVVGQALWILTDAGVAKVAIADLDMAATQRANITRTLLFGSASGN